MNNTVKSDCFADIRDFVLNKEKIEQEGCLILTEMLCLKKECPFYKTKKKCMEV